MPLFMARSVQDRSFHHQDLVKSRHGRRKCRYGVVELDCSALLCATQRSLQEAAVREWMDFMKGNGMRRMLCLLTESELSFYSKPLLEQLSAAFDVAWIPLSATDVRRQLLQVLSNAERAQEPVVVFCSTVRQPYAGESCV